MNSTAPGVETRRERFTERLSARTCLFQTPLCPVIHVCTNGRGGMGVSPVRRSKSPNRRITLETLASFEVTTQEQTPVACSHTIHTKSYDLKASTCFQIKNPRPKDRNASISTITAKICEREDIITAVSLLGFAKTRQNVIKQR